MNKMTQGKKTDLPWCLNVNVHITDISDYRYVIMSLVSNRPFIDIVAPLGVFRKRKKQQQQQQQNTVKYWGGGGKK